MNQENKAAAKYLRKRKESSQIDTEIVWPTTKRHIEDLQQRARRCKTELISVENKIVKCLGERSINRKIKRLKTVTGRRYVYVVNGSKAQIVQRIFQTWLKQEFDYTLPSDDVRHTFILKREAGCDEWQEWSSEEASDTGVVKMCNTDEDDGYLYTPYQGLTMNDHPIEDKNEDWELKFDLDKKDASEMYTVDKKTHSLRKYLSSQVVLFGHQSTIAKLREHVNHTNWRMIHLKKNECGLDASECKHNRATWETQEKKSQEPDAKTKPMGSDESTEQKTIPEHSKEEAEVENSEQEEDDDEDDKVDDEEKKTKPYSTWKQWHADDTDESCLDSLDDEFNKVWLKKMKSKKYYSLDIENVLSAIRRYHPTKSKPFVVDTAMLEGNGRSRIGYLISKYFEDYEKNGPEMMHKHGLAASCYVRGSPMFARSVFHIYESERGGLPVDAYIRIHEEYNEYDSGF